MARTEPPVVYPTTIPFISSNTLHPIHSGSHITQLSCTIPIGFSPCLDYHLCSLHHQSLRQIASHFRNGTRNNSRSNSSNSSIGKSSKGSKGSKGSKHNTNNINQGKLTHNNLLIHHRIKTSHKDSRCKCNTLNIPSQCSSDTITRNKLTPHNSKCKGKGKGKCMYNKGKTLNKCIKSNWNMNNRLNRKHKTQHQTPLREGLAARSALHHPRQLYSTRGLKFQH